MKLLGVVRLSTLMALSCVSSQIVALAQTKAETAEKPAKLTVTDAHKAASAHYSDFKIHLLPRVGATGVVRDIARPGEKGVGTAAVRPAAIRPDSVSTAVVPSPGFYPSDLSYQGGTVLQSTRSVNLYLNSTSGTWGHPGAFLKDFGKSDFVHVLDQYTGSTADNRYTLDATAELGYPILASTLGDNDLLQIAYAGASYYGAGYDHVYHVFLPPGVDYCSGTSCYSPDNSSTFAFCAFHGSVTFSDIGEVLFTLEPYQNVPGCQEAPGSPNGQLVDSTASVLSHELSETITDPEGTGWLAFNSLSVYGEEIGDLCSAVSPTGPYFLNPVSVLNGKKYEIQFEYSDTYHACANVQ